MKTCNEVMTKDPVYCVKNDMVGKAAEFMKSEHISAVPVVEDERGKKLVGIVTDRDLALRVLAEGLNAKATQVGIVMTRKVITCHGKDDAQQALEKMSRHKLQRVPIVDDENKLVGMIARIDLQIRRNKPGTITRLPYKPLQISGD